MSSVTWLATILPILLISTTALTGCQNSQNNYKGKTLTIYNCEDYIYADDETGFTMVDAFEEWYEETNGVDITVQYDTYATNETMYNQVVNLQNDYDLIVASDYMIEKMRNENHLEEIDYSLIPNYETYVSPYLKKVFDENNS